MCVSLLLVTFQRSPEVHPQNLLGDRSAARCQGALQPLGHLLSRGAETTRDAGALRDRQGHLPLFRPSEVARSGRGRLLGGG